MISLRRDIPAPEFLTSDRVTNILAAARQAVANGDKPKLPELWAEDDGGRVKQHERHHNGKCCYCERKRDIYLERDVEHYRPKKGVKGIDHLGYWWLAYDWNNLLIACKTCNSRYKGTQFPLVEPDSRVFEEGDITGERPFILNPAIEDPEPFISYQYEKEGGEWIVFPLPRHHTDTSHRQRAEETIRIAGLAREELMGSEERAECMPLLMRLLKNWKGHKFLLKRANDTRRDLVTEAADQQLIEQSSETIAGYEAEIAKIEEELRIQMQPKKTYAGFRRYLIAKETDGEITL